MKHSISSNEYKKCIFYFSEHSHIMVARNSKGAIVLDLMSQNNYIQSKKIDPSYKYLQVAVTPGMGTKWVPRGYQGKSGYQVGIKWVPSGYQECAKGKVGTKGKVSTEGKWVRSV